MISVEYGNTPAHKNEGCVQVLVVLPRIISVKLLGFSAVYCEEVGSGVIGPERLKKLFEGGMDASKQGVNYPTIAVK